MQSSLAHVERKDFLFLYKFFPLIFIDVFFSFYYFVESKEWPNTQVWLGLNFFFPTLVFLLHQPLFSPPLLRFGFVVSKPYFVTCYFPCQCTFVIIYKQNAIDFT